MKGWDVFGGTKRMGQGEGVVGWDYKRMVYLEQ